MSDTIQKGNKMAMGAGAYTADTANAVPYHLFGR